MEAVSLPTEEAAKSTATTKQSAETSNDLAERLNNRYDIIHLIFEFLLSALVLSGSFAAIVSYKDQNVTSGAVAISTLVISYWFGKSKPSSR